MIPLAINAARQRALRAKVQFALSVLPLGLMCAAFAAVLSLRGPFETALGIVRGSSVRNHPDGIMWMVAFLGATVLLMIAAYLLGWLANALFARFVLGWPAAQVGAAHLRSDVPGHWLKAPAGTKRGLQHES
ncbi:hypothetical protein [Massilia glaciei]|uniref:Uncharacterized protein n=1 Tax=Massilia glaciei TaxID=1524097 RepID=A0A2U2I4H4_9BURK|nr:hypothetical protein [Massilia glaciei]PWF54704.1 hypothetical protein C7C56_005490 [Massilia glaciei]